jgi:WD40 repeat protein/serine/threonine protein kinase
VIHPSQKACTRCGQTFPGDGVHGLCPRCLGEVAFAVDEIPDTPVARSSTLNSQPSTELRRFGDYELIEEIARGGMGVVFKARQCKLDRVVALKLLLSGQFASRDAIERFHAEALTAAKLRHPNIVPVYDVGDANGQPFLAMEFVAGENLAEVVRDHPLSARRGAELVRTTAEAVHYAHEQGVLHRDLKPSNVLLDDSGQPRITDFGLAKRLGLRQPSAALAPGETMETDPSSALATPSEGARELAHSKSPRTPDPQHSTQDRLNCLTLTGQVLGSPSFIAPEQAAGKRGELGPAVDVYSLGAILFHLLTGRPPFQSATIEETLHEVLQREPVSPRLLNPGVPRDLETICLRCLEKEPSRRYAAASDVADELSRFLRDEPIHARPISPGSKLWRWCRRKPTLAASIAALHVVAAAGLAGILWQWSRAEQHATRETTQRQRAEEAVTMLELQRVEDLLEKDESVRGVAHLARIVRQQPTNRIAAQRLISVLSQRDFVLPVGRPLQHGGAVNYVEFSPDGRWVVTASSDRTARLWDARTSQPIGGSLLHSNAVRYAHFSPDGQRLLTVADNDAALIWDTATGNPIGQPLRHEKQVRSAQFSPDGRWIVTTSDDRTARLWDRRTGGPSLSPLRHPGPVRCASISPNSKWIATISGGTAFLWDMESRQLVGQPLSHGTNESVEDAPLFSARFSPDSRRIVTASQMATVRMWEVPTGRPITEQLQFGDEVRWAEFSPDGGRVVAASVSGEMQLCGAATGRPLMEPLRHRTGLDAAQFSPDGQRLLAGFPDNTTRLRDARTGRLLTVPFQHDGVIRSACFSPDGHLVVTASEDATARIWDIRPGRAFHLTFAHAGRVQFVHFSPEGDRIATSCQDGTWRVWGTRTGRPRTPPVRHPGGSYPAMFSPDGQRILTGSWDGTARLWDAHSGRALTEWLPHEGKVNYAEFSPDGKWFLTLTRNKGIRLWDAHTGQLCSELIRHPALSRFARFSPDSKTLVAGLDDIPVIRIVDINTGKTRVEFQAHRGILQNVHFSSDSRRLATASTDGSARVWDTATGAPLTPPLHHKSEVWDVRFSSDGSRIVTASADATARVWDVETGRALTEPLRHRAILWEAAFSPDGQQILTSSFDGTACLWDANTGRPLADPFQHGNSVFSAIFSPDGRSIATASVDSTARVWEPPTTVASGGTLAATHLADLAEAVIGQRLNIEGTLEPVLSHRLVELRERSVTMRRKSPTRNACKWTMSSKI